LDCKAEEVPMAASTNERGVRERSTRQFQAVLEELARSEDFRSAQDLHTAMRERGAVVGLATVYRALQSLVESGQADAVRTASGESVYRECSREHHHHLVCRWCGRTVEVKGPAVERWADQMAAQHGFVDVSHTLELFGTCEDCARREQ
jgi:Fur family transcriptional regulator, ferric uptake regulator